ncbi:MAG: ATP synthase F1 subunit epsilon [Planctomycetota bacterium]
MTKPLHCCIITPEQQLFDADATNVVLPAHDGLIGVMNLRAPLLCELGTGVLRVDTPTEGSKEFYVDGGFAQVLNNDVTILTERAAAAETISKSESEKALTVANQMPMSDDKAIESRRRAVARAQAQIKIAKK